MKYKKGIFGVAFVGSLILGWGQNSCLRHERRIFLWDITNSLVHNGMWDPLKNSLCDAFDAIDEDEMDEIILVQFAHTIISIDSVPATKDGKNQLKKIVKKKAAKDAAATSTNIVAAIQQFHKLAKSGCINYMFLYTDGAQNTGKTNTSTLVTEINQWNYLDKFGFYVTVAPPAKIPLVLQAVDAQNNFWVVDDANVRIRIYQINTPISYNILQDQSKEISILGDCQKLNGCKVVIQAVNDPYYSVSVSNANLQSGILGLKINAKIPLATIPKNYKLKCSVSLNNPLDKYTFLIPEIIEIDCINKQELIANTTIRTHKAHR